MASIYELTDQYRALEAAAYEDDLEYDEFSARLAQIEDAIEDKTDGYCAVIAGLKADAAAIKEQEQRLAKRRLRPRGISCPQCVHGDSNRPARRWSLISIQRC